MKQESTFRTASDWNNRYREDGLQQPGTRSHSNVGNALFYRAKFDALDRCLKAIGVGLEGSRVLDAAGGSGEFIPYFLARNCRSVTIADYSEVAIEIVRRRWRGEPRVQAYVADMTSISPELLPNSYDFVFVQEAIFLIADDERWARAIASLSQYVAPNGYIIISDVFPATPHAANAYVIHRSRDQFESHLAAASFRTVGYVRQSVLFNQRCFGRIQVFVEHLGSLYYWLDRCLRVAGYKPPEDIDIKYLMAKKSAQR